MTNPAPPDVPGVLVEAYRRAQADHLGLWNGTNISRGIAAAIDAWSCADLLRRKLTVECPPPKEGGCGGGGFEFIKREGELVAQRGRPCPTCDGRGRVLRDEVRQRTASLDLGGLLLEEVDALEALLWKLMESYA